MFVSSYNTYISKSNSQNVKQDSNHRNSSKEYSNKLFTIDNNIKNESVTTLPLNYISEYKSLSNQQKLVKKDQSQENKYNKINTFVSAKKAYNENSISFTISYTPKPAISEINNNSILNVSTTQALNTYIENDNYYRVTA